MSLYFDHMCVCEWDEGCGGHSLELTEGQDSQGFPQPWPCEQQHDALETPTPISLEQSKLSEASPLDRTSRKQLPERVSVDDEHICSSGSSMTERSKEANVCSERRSAVTNAADPSRVQLKVRWAVAGVTSRDVDAHAINADGRVGAFIDI